MKTKTDSAFMDERRRRSTRVQSQSNERRLESGIVGNQITPPHSLFDLIWFGYVVAIITVNRDFGRLEGDYLTDDELDINQKSKELNAIMLKQECSISTNSICTSIYTSPLKNDSYSGEQITLSSFLDKIERNVFEAWKTTAKKVQFKEFLEM
jgi:hypothetical protein